MTKIHVKDGSQEPSDDTYFIVAGNGTFLRKKNNWVDAIVPIKTIDGLESCQPQATLRLPRIKSTTFAKAVSFFSLVYAKQKTESAVLLHYSEKYGWDITVPPQEVTWGHVRYDMRERIPGYRCVGTMHSHGSMSAFHSGTDIENEAQFDGIHITIGRVDKFPLFEVDAEFVVNGTRFPLAQEHIIYLKEAKLFGVLSRATGKGKKLFTMPFGILRDWKVPKEWMSRVNNPAVSLGRSAPLPLFAKRPVALPTKEEKA